MLKLALTRSAALDKSTAISGKAISAAISRNISGGGGGVRADSGDLVECTFRHDDHVALLSFNSPAKLNALTVELGDRFRDRVEELKTKDGLRAVVLTGKGKAFSAGGDLDWLIDRHKRGHFQQENADTMVGFYKRFLCLRELPCPVIAALNGPAIGAGFCVAIGGCDMRIASTTAKMGLNFVKLGLHPGMAATHFLPQLVGPSVAADLLLTGRLVGAKEALELRLVNKVCEDPVDEALKVASLIATACGPVAVRQCLETLRSKQNQGLEESMRVESTAQAVTYATMDFLEGVVSIKEKRFPDFQGV